MTTPIYRAPEQLDLIQGYQLTEKVDVWALGIVMFTLMFHRPPFEEGAKLSKLNGQIYFPVFPEYSRASIELVRSMLLPNPEQRPSAADVFKFTLEKSGNAHLSESMFQFNHDIVRSQF
jgi:serine/threonine protein kinase